MPGLRDAAVVVFWLELRWSVLNKILEVNMSRLDHIGPTLSRIHPLPFCVTLAFYICPDGVCGSTCKLNISQSMWIHKTLHHICRHKAHIRNTFCCSLEQVPFLWGLCSYYIRSAVCHIALLCSALAFKLINHSSFCGSSHKPWKCHADLVSRYFVIEEKWLQHRKFERTCLKITYFWRFNVRKIFAVVCSTEVNSACPSCMLWYSLLKRDICILVSFMKLQTLTWLSFGATTIIFWTHKFVDSVQLIVSDKSDDRLLLVVMEPRPRFIIPRLAICVRCV